jgi:hypothetical protein
MFFPYALAPSRRKLEGMDNFTWAVIETYKKFGPAPVIGAFEPGHGDLGRDTDDPLSQIRMWVGDDWSPNYTVVPKK